MFSFAYHSIKERITPRSNDWGRLAIELPLEPWLAMGVTASDVPLGSDSSPFKNQISSHLETLPGEEPLGQGRAIESPVLRLDEAITGGLAWFLMAMGLYEWGNHFFEPAPVIEYVPRSGSGKWFRQMNHLVKKNKKALDALERYSKDEVGIRAYKDALEFHEEAYESLKELRHKKNPSNDLLTMVPQKDQEECEGDMRYLLEEMEEELRIKRVYLRHGQWVKK